LFATLRQRVKGEKVPPKGLKLCANFEGEENLRKNILGANTVGGKGVGKGEACGGSFTHVSSKKMCEVSCQAKKGGKTKT